MGFFSGTDCYGILRDLVGSWKILGTLRRFLADVKPILWDRLGIFQTDYSSEGSSGILKRILPLRAIVEGF